MEIAGLNPVRSARNGFVAQSVEQRSEEPCVGSSILPEATMFLFFLLFVPIAIAIFVGIATLRT